MNLEDSSRAAVEAPSELAGSLPRKVQMYSTDGRYLLSIALLFLVCSAIFTVSYLSEAIHQTQQRAVLRSDGRDVVGEVTGLSVGRWAPTVVKYRLTINGETYSGSAKEPRSPEPGTALNASDKILVRFLPSNPAINHPAGWEWSALMGLDSIVLQIILLTVSGIALAALLRDRKLAREGKVAAGAVTSCTRKDREFRVEYEFRTEEGVLMTGKSGYPDQYEAGGRIWILYLPQRPQRNHSYPLAFYAVID